MKHKAQVTRHTSQGPGFYFCLMPFALCLAIACTGCGSINPVINEGSYLTYDHPFTDAAALAVLRSAEKICAERKRNAMKSTSTCSLTQCTTHYLCVDQAKNLGIGDKG